MNYMQNQKIKIAYVITKLICGGAQKIILSLAGGLDKDKYQLTVISGQVPDSEKDCVAQLAEANVKLVIVPQLIRNISPLNDLFALCNIFRLIKNGGFDIVHTHTSKAGALGRLAAFFAGTPVIIHSPHGNIFEPQGKIPGVSDKPLARVVFLFIERLLAKFTDKIITLSEDEKSKYEELKIDKGNKFLAIYEGIDCEGFTSRGTHIHKQDFGFKDSDFIVSTIGRLDSEKGHIYLIEAAASVLKENAQVKFLIIGEGASRKELEDYAVRLGISDSVRFLGLRKDIPDLLSITDVFVLPSLYEGLGIVVLEAMAMSLPVIATKVGGVPEVIINGETGILVPPGNSRAIAEGIISILNNKEKARTMGHNACLYVKSHFAINLMVEKIEKLYNDLLEAKFLTKEG